MVSNDRFPTLLGATWRDRVSGFVAGAMSVVVAGCVFAYPPRIGNPLLLAGSGLGVSLLAIGVGALRPFRSVRRAMAVGLGPMVLVYLCLAWVEEFGARPQPWKYAGIAGLWIALVTLLWRIPADSAVS